VLLRTIDVLAVKFLAAIVGDADSTALAAKILPFFGKINRKTLRTGDRLAGIVNGSANLLRLGARPDQLEAEAHWSSLVTSPPPCQMALNLGMLRARLRDAAQRFAALAVSGVSRDIAE
jgi:hypothetical protein